MGRWVSGTASEFAAVGGARHARWPSCVGCNRNRRGKSKKAKALAPPPSCQPLFLYAGPVFVALAPGVFSRIRWCPGASGGSGGSGGSGVGNGGGLGRAFVIVHYF